MAIQVSRLAYISVVLIHLFTFVLGNGVESGFTPDRDDYNAYGLKVAMNELLLVQVQNKYNPPKFVVQFAPFTSENKSIQCSIQLPTLTDHYVYSVAMGENRAEFFFAGELINGQRGTFVGIGTFNSSILNSQTSTATQSSLCSTAFSHSVEDRHGYTHEEHLRLTVHPMTDRAYGFANQFVFAFNPSGSPRLQLWNANTIWPNLSFMPHAVEIADQFGIIAGFIENVREARPKFLPIVYLIRFNVSDGFPTVVDQHIPSATSNTWQDLLTNDDVELYSAKYDMSVSINGRGEVLVGMPFINRVFLLSVNLSNPVALVYKSRFTNGPSVGYGKGVCWLNNGSMAAVLANVYSLDYEWQSSRIQIYDMQASLYNSDSQPLSVFPNYHQNLPTHFHSILLNIISSSTLLTLMDFDGNLLVFVPTSPGFFPAIPTRQSSPVITYPQVCLPGTAKDLAGIHDCILCPSGTKNGGSANTRCVPCSTGSFCPLGASDETTLPVLDTVSISVSYQHFTDTRSFETVLLDYIFGIRQQNCRITPAMIWTMFGAGIGLVLTLVIYVLKRYPADSCLKKMGKSTKSVLRRVDLIGEGHHWIRGLASLAMIVLLAFSYAFSYQFFYGYPTENTTPSYLSCDSTPANAFFQSTVKSLDVIKNKQEQQMIDLLNKQKLTLNLQFVNTFIDCDAVAIEGLFGPTWVILRWFTCENHDSTLSISIPLPQQYLTVKVTLSDIKTIGGLRVGLSGDEYRTNNLVLRKLNFAEAFYKNGYLLGKAIALSLFLNRVIDESICIHNAKSLYGGALIAAFAHNRDNVLLSPQQYIFSRESSTTLFLSLNESLDYAITVQQPLATTGKFTFTMICLELFRLGVADLTGMNNERVTLQLSLPSQSNVTFVSSLCMSYLFETSRG